MYQAAYYDRTSYTYHLRDDERGWIDFKYTPELYRIDPNGPLETLDGKRAYPVQKYEWRDISLYEQDVDKLTRVLIELYKDSDDTPKFHNLVYFDIECEIGGALTTEYIKSAPMKITSISVYDNTTKRFYCYILDEKNLLKEATNGDKIVLPFRTEKELLSKFLDLWEEIDPTIISGWNSGFLGKIEYEGNLDRLYQEDINKFIEYNLRDVEILIELEKKLKFIDLTVTVCHLCHVPYEQIYLSTVLNDGAILTYLKRQGIVSPNKPTTINPLLKESTNDEYAGGYLKDPIPGLYEWVIDLDFTSLYPSIIRSLNIGIETLVGRIVNKDKYDNQWTYNELSVMNPEDLVIIEKLKEDFTLARTQVPVSKIMKMIKDNKWIIAASGAIFRTDKSSVVCEVLTDWFNKRVEYKNLMKKAFKVDKDPVMGEFYNRRQHAYKIKLNDVYGCYAINGWRYTDGHKIISSAITLTGQRVTQESIKFVNRWMNQLLNTTDKDYVVTSDTDSLFIQVKDILVSRGVDLNNKEECIKNVLEIANEIQKASNEFIGSFANEAFNLNNKEHYFELKQEVVIERSYHSGKRRYAMLIVNKEGVPTEELVMMGLDLMKSNMPPLYKKFGQDLLAEIMSGKSKKEIDQTIINFKTSLNNMPWSDIAKPTGVKQINSYIAKRPSPGEIFSELKLKCPINTKAAVYYNDILRFKKLDKKYPCFTEGDKMKYVSLKSNPFKIDVIGFTNNDPEFITDFINQYVDREDAFNSVLLNKLQGVYEDIGWGDDFPVLDAKITRFFKF